MLIGSVTVDVYEDDMYMSGGYRLQVTVTELRETYTLSEMLPADIVKAPLETIWEMIGQRLLKEIKAHRELKRPSSTP